VLAVAFSPDSRRAATASADNRARLWELATGKLTQLKHYGPVWAVAFSPDGRRLLTGSADPNARLWDVATGIPIGAALRHRGGSVRALAFASDSRTFLTGSNSNIARLGRAPLPVSGDAERVALWLQVLTGTEMVDGVELMLDGASWQDRRRRLQALGGPPQH
jgi:WD40 repeat protein